MPTAAYCWTVRWEPSARRPDRPRLTDSITSGAARTRSAAVTTTETSATAFAQAAKNSVVNPAFADTHAWKQESGAAVSTLEYAAAHRLSFLSNKGATGVYDWLAKPRADLWNTAKTCYDPCPWGRMCRTAIRGTILRTIRTAMWTEPRNGMGRSTA